MEEKNPSKPLTFRELISSETKRTVYVIRYSDGVPEMEALTFMKGFTTWPLKPYKLYLIVYRLDGKQSAKHTIELKIEEYELDAPSIKRDENGFMISTSQKEAIDFFSALISRTRVELTEALNNYEKLMKEMRWKLEQVIGIQESLKKKEFLTTI